MSTGEHPTVSEAAETGDRRATLEALRAKLAATIDGWVEPKELAALSMRLERVLEQLDDLGSSESHDAVDDLRRKRAERLARTGSEDR